jgi:hypothetical protein
MSIGNFPTVSVSSGDVLGINLDNVFFKQINVNYSSGSYSLSGKANIYKLFDGNNFTIYYGVTLLTNNNFPNPVSFNIAVPEITQKSSVIQDRDIDIHYRNNNTSWMRFRNGYIQFDLYQLDTTAQGITYL